MYEKLLQYLQYVKKLEVEKYTIERMIEMLEGHKASIDAVKLSIKRREVPLPKKPHLEIYWQEEYEKMKDEKRLKNPLEVEPGSKPQCPPIHEIPKYEDWEHKEWKIIAIVLCIVAFIGNLIFAGDKLVISLICVPIIGLLCFLGDLVIFNAEKQKMQEANERIEKAYERECREYEEKIRNLKQDEEIRKMQKQKEMMEEKKRIDRENQAKLESFQNNEWRLYKEKAALADKEYEAKHQKLQAIIDGDDEQISELKKIQSSLKQALDKVYSVDVIYSSYRSMVPVVMFVKYLESKRCCGLEGNDGAYNLYEQELRAEKILSTLENISSKLEVIMANQRELYDTFQEANRQLEMLNYNVTLQTAVVSASIEELRSTVAVQNMILEEERKDNRYFAQLSLDQQKQEAEERRIHAAQMEKITEYQNSVLQDIRMMKVIELCSRI